MCVGNRASSSAYYINKQFETLWEISKECVVKHGHGVKPTRAEVEYGSCLAQLCVGKHARNKPCTDDLKFFASFGAPQLQFICNHEAILTLHLNSGHYKPDGKPSSEAFEGYTCAFRVQFHEHLITDASFSTFGQTAACKTKILILDLNTASFLREFSGFPKGHKLSSETVDRHHKSIVKYLSTYYLPLIRKAGFHCIYSLPDFDNLSRTHMIDYSTVSEVDVEITEIFGISIESINTFMAGRWLQNASCADDLDEHHDHSSFGQFALAEHRGVCDDISFHAFFGPPQIHALCPKEVIFYVDIRDLHFYLGGFHGEADHKVSNWKIAVVVEVHLVEEEGGCVRRLRLDFSKSRFCEHRSIFTSSETIEESIFVKLRTSFVQYITKRYLVILEEFRHHHVYHVDTRVIEVESDYDTDTDEEDETTMSVSEFRERVCITETFGYDLITTIAQGSINDHLYSLWKACQSTSSCLASWTLEESFGASFGPLQLQFPCDSSSRTVIVYLDLRKGFLTKLGRAKTCIGGEKHYFSSWRVAFEVDLTFRDYTKDHTISDGARVGQHLLQQLVFDFRTAKFRQDLSRLPGILEGGDYPLMRSKCSALLHYITQFYWAQLKREGHHVIYTIPVHRQGGSHGLIQHAMVSSVAFHFLPTPCGEGEKYVSCLFGSQRHLGSRNMLVICGMVDPAHHPVVPLPRCSWSWSSSNEVFSGGFVLSRSMFLDGWLLPELQRINERTTLVPRFQGIRHDGKFDLELVAWKEHACNTDKTCHWTQKEDCGKDLVFEWKNLDEWTYMRRGDARDSHNGGYTISCKTENYLTLPTISHHGTCEIKIEGKIDLDLHFNGAKKDWSSSATAKWSAKICLTGDRHGTGLKVTASSSTCNISEPSGFTSDFDIVDPSTLLKQRLEKVVLVEDSTIHELESAFAGVWPLFYSGAYGYTLTNPIFNGRGDFLFELVRPIDREGNVCVSEGDRHDICLPSKTSAISRAVQLTRGSSFMSGLTSMLTSTTGIHSPLKTPPSLSESKVEIKGEHERVNFGTAVHAVPRTLDEKVHRSFDAYHDSDSDGEAEVL